MPLFLIRFSVLFTILFLLSGCSNTLTNTILSLIQQGIEPFIHYLSQSVIFMVLSLLVFFLAIKFGSSHSRLVGGILVTFGALLALMAYYGGFSHPFRSDAYIEYNLFSDLTYSFNDLLQAARFEMFGHRRVQPLAHSMVFFQYKILGTNHFLHHLFQYSIHLVNGILVYILVVRLTTNRLVAGMASLLFLTFYTHLDSINWIYHSYVIFPCTLALLAYICILEYFNKFKRIYIYLALTLFFMAQLFYEANVFFPFSGLVFFAILAYQHKIPFPKFKQIVAVFMTGFIIVSVLYSAIFLYEIKRTQATEPNSGQVSFSGIVSINNIRHAIKTTAIFLWDPLILKSFAFPSDMKVRDITYQKGVQIRAGPIEFVIAAICALIILLSFRVKKKNLLFIAMFVLLLLSFVFILSLGRGVSAPPDYVQSQYRYTYFPNLMLIIVFALLITEKANLKHWTGRILLGAILIVASLNAHRVYRHTDLITHELSSLTNHISQVNDFYEQHQDESDFKIFVNFPFVQENKSFNLGADIALDIYHRNRITRNIYKAKYILEKNSGFRANPLYQKKAPANPDFTIEFVIQLYSPHFGKIFTIVGDKEDKWYVAFDHKGQLIYGFKHDVNGKISARKLSPNFQFKRHQPHHVIIQKQNDKLYFVIDGKVIEIINLNGVKIIDINKDSSSYVVGDIYSGAEVLALSTSLFISLGKSQYSLENKKVGNRVKVTWIEPWQQ